MTLDYQSGRIYGPENLDFSAGKSGIDIAGYPLSLLEIKIRVLINENKLILA